MAANEQQGKKAAGKKRQTRRRNYRIPYHKDEHDGSVHFPTIETLFRFVREVLKDLVQEERDENVFDSEVARFIYPGYPYAHQFKLGLKNVNSIIELTLLSRNLGIPFRWIQKIRKGEWSEEAALRAYHDRKGDRALAAQATHTGSAGSFDVTIAVDEHDPALLGDIYATVINHLRPAVTDAKIDKKSGTFV